MLSTDPGVSHSDLFFLLIKRADYKKRIHHMQKESADCARNSLRFVFIGRIDKDQHRTAQGS